MRSAFPALYELIQRKRNAWWAHQIDELLAAGGTHLIVIGMNHVLGPDGIPRQLADMQLAPSDVGG